jgi:hypothetical protein
MHDSGKEPDTKITPHTCTRHVLHIKPRIPEVRPQVREGLENSNASTPDLEWLALYANAANMPG